ncbi:MAG: 4Fe-4S dicluster domain-containing protein [Deltaproteobacteria bacterium]|nr:4Fe-4S dicluster domain-containing protein [Deltaproteobacteria bacterium]
MSAQLLVQPKNCTGCKSCMLICSFYHTDAFSYEDARLWIEKNESRGISTPVVCRNCDDAPCIEACPVEAIGRKPPHGWTIIDETLCNGCGECVVVCPYEAVQMHPERDVAVKCDLCDGDPQCVRVCRLPEALVWR